MVAGAAVVAIRVGTYVAEVWQRLHMWLPTQTQYAFRTAGLAQMWTSASAIG